MIVIHLEEIIEALHDGRSYPLLHARYQLAVDTCHQDADHRNEQQTGEYEYYQGSLEISHKLNKIDREHYRIQFTVNPTDPPVFVYGDSESVNAEESDLQMIRQKAAAAFLKVLTGLPEEDLQYIIADLPDNWWKQSIQITEKPEETEKP